MVYIISYLVPAPSWVPEYVYVWTPATETSLSIVFLRYVIVILSRNSDLLKHCLVGHTASSTITFALTSLLMALATL